MSDSSKAEAYHSLTKNVSQFRSYQVSLQDRLRLRPEVVRLREHVSLFDESGDTAGVDTEIRKFLNADKDWLREELGFIIKAAAEEPDLLMPFIDSPLSKRSLWTVLLIQVDDSLAIQLSALFPSDLKNAKRGAIVNFSGQNDYLHVLDGSTVEFERYNCQEFGETVNFNELTCQKIENLTLNKGETYVVCGRREAVSILNVEKPTIFLQVTHVRGSASVHVDFVKETGLFKEAHHRNGKAARKMYLMSVLRHLNVEDRTRFLEDYSQHGPFYQRWYAARELLHHDLDKGVERIGEMLNDENPSIRLAADKTLALVERIKGENHDD